MDQKKVGRFLKTLRKEKELTQEALAEILKVSGRTVSRWETGSNMPDIGLLVELSEFYKVSIPEIIDGERKCEKMEQETKNTGISNSYKKNEAVKDMEIGDAAARDTVMKADAMKDTIVKMAEYSKHEFRRKRRQTIQILFMVFGVFLMISAFAVFPNESSWGSIYAVIGGGILIVGIDFRMKAASVKRSLRIGSMIGCMIGLFGIFTVLDYIAVSQFSQVPRFSYEKSSGENVVEHKTLFYTVIQRNPGTADESVEILSVGHGR